MFRKLFVRKKRDLPYILNWIKTADDYEISHMILAIVKRYSKVYPDWEVMFLSLPKDPEERREQLVLMMEMLQKPFS